MFDVVAQIDESRFFLGLRWIQREHGGYSLFRADCHLPFGGPGSQSVQCPLDVSFSDTYVLVLAPDGQVVREQRRVHILGEADGDIIYQDVEERRGGYSALWGSVPEEAKSAARSIQPDASLTVSEEP